MSALDFKAVLVAKLEMELYGDNNERSGLINSVASGAITKHEDYCRMTGMIRGLRVAIDLIDQSWQQVYNPQPDEAQKHG